MIGRGRASVKAVVFDRAMYWSRSEERGDGSEERESKASGERASGAKSGLTSGVKGKNLDTSFVLWAAAPKLSLPDRPEPAMGCRFVSFLTPPDV